jgi:hypothetical protein
LEFRRKHINLIKSKARNDANEEQELIKQVNKLNEQLISLAEHKTELTNEILYLIEYHLKNLNGTIESFEKSLNSTNAPPQQNIPIEYKLEKAESVIGDNISIAGSSKIYFLQKFR